jgi:hypothetical protein
VELARCGVELASEALEQRIALRYGVDVSLALNPPGERGDPGGRVERRGARDEDEGSGAPRS